MSGKLINYQPFIEISFVIFITNVNRAAGRFAIVGG